MKISDLLENDDPTNITRRGLLKGIMGLAAAAAMPVPAVEKAVKSSKIKASSLAIFTKMVKASDFLTASRAAVMMTEGGPPYDAYPAKDLVDIYLWAKELPEYKEYYGDDNELFHWESITIEAIEEKSNEEISQGIGRPLAIEKIYNTLDQYEFDFETFANEIYNLSEQLYAKGARNTGNNWTEGERMLVSLMREKENSNKGDSFADKAKDIAKDVATDKVGDLAMNALRTQAAAGALDKFKELVKRVIGKIKPTPDQDQPTVKHMGKADVVEPNEPLGLPAPGKSDTEIMADLRDLLNRQLNDREKEVVKQELKKKEND